MHHDLTALLRRMETDLTLLTAEGDARRFFHATYLRTTRAVAQEIDLGSFADAGWLQRWDLAFAELYLDAFAADRAGQAVPQPWRVAFDAADQRPDLPPLRHVLLGMNAHINYDLPQALLAVISPDQFDDPRMLSARAADHRHVDQVLVARVVAEDAELSAASRLSPIDRLLRPLSRAATRHLITEARAKVWANTAALDRARRTGPDRYVEVLTELEELCAARLRDLTAPGQVLLKLTRRGFGVRLTEADGRR